MGRGVEGGNLSRASMCAEGRAAGFAGARVGKKYAETVLGRPWGCPLRWEVTDMGEVSRVAWGLLSRAAGRTLQLEGGQVALQVGQEVVSQEGL